MLLFSGITLKMTVSSDNFFTISHAAIYQIIVSFLVVTIQYADLSPLSMLNLS